MTQEAPAVSVVMPAHNSARFIAQAIGSVGAQTFTDWELLVVDDASTDGTETVARRAIDQGGLSRRVRFFANRERSGPAVTRNRAIAEARGRWIAFLDSDDLWTADKLERQLPMFDDARVRLVCGGYAVIDAEGRETGERSLPPPRATYEAMLRMNTVGCLTAIYDSERSGKVLMPLIPRRQDYGLWLALIRPEGVIAGLPRVVGQYRVHSGSVSSSKLAVAYWQWRLYRDHERLPIGRSLGCLWNHAVNKKAKYSH